VRQCGKMLGIQVNPKYGFVASDTFDMTHTVSLREPSYMAVLSHTHGVFTQSGEGLGVVLPHHVLFGPRPCQ
jgi:hypothetical protein